MRQIFLFSPHDTGTEMYRIFIECIDSVCGVCTIYGISYFVSYWTDNQYIDLQAPSIILTFPWSNVYAVVCSAISMVVLKFCSGLVSCSRINYAPATYQCSNFKHWLERT